MSASTSAKRASWWQSMGRAGIGNLHHHTISILGMAVVNIGDLAIECLDEAEWNFSWASIDA
ncbi:hypothetical protein N7468_008344 [Penicillium chermesinum]|uniref:Uncharacterized protein n=1 Tax=Penicillium chermesinum TaxID=63820 RepID=A0A9W9TI70_9EURO|nr:uncharacterized protein N7468_008344 [Penicillium chermesinum]KAJ5223802.1 hypothetical protein N7468_008344 [Penicillium chermesinum]KAJ6155373.1 hypothetical protein N7470_005939 [Penicillium chermesinum]